MEVMVTERLGFSSNVSASVRFKLNVKMCHS